MKNFTFFDFIHIGVLVLRFGCACAVQLLCVIYPITIPFLNILLSGFPVSPNWTIAIFYGIITANGYYTFIYMRGLRPCALIPKRFAFMVLYRNRKMQNKW